MSFPFSYIFPSGKIDSNRTVKVGFCSFHKYVVAPSKGLITSLTTQKYLLKTLVFCPLREALSKGLYLIGTKDKTTFSPYLGDGLISAKYFLMVSSISIFYVCLMTVPLATTFRKLILQLNKRIPPLLFSMPQIYSLISFQFYFIYPKLPRNATFTLLCLLLMFQLDKKCFSQPRHAGFGKISL